MDAFSVQTDGLLRALTVLSVKCGCYALSKDTAAKSLSCCTVNECRVRLKLKLSFSHQSSTLMHFHMIPSASVVCK